MWGPQFGPRPSIYIECDLLVFSDCFQFYHVVSICYTCSRFFFSLSCFLSDWFEVLFLFGGLPTPTAYGGSQARGRIRAASATYTTAHSNAGSLTHCVRPGIEPVSSWILVRFLTCWTTAGSQRFFIYFVLFCFVFSFCNCTHGMWKFLGQGANPSHSQGNAGSLAHPATVGTPDLSC